MLLLYSIWRKNIHLTNLNQACKTGAFIEEVESNLSRLHATSGDVTLIDSTMPASPRLPPRDTPYDVPEPTSAQCSVAC